MVKALRELAEQDCLQLLASRVVGRVALVEEGEVRVFPVNYLFDRGEILFRTDDGVKLDAARAGGAATFEVDDSDPLYHTGWSVMATGKLQEVTEQDALHRVQGLPLRAWGGTGRHWIRLAIASITGRRIAGAVER